MAFSKSNRRARPRRRRPAGRKLAPAQRKQVKAMIKSNIELKYYAGSLLPTSITSTGACSPVGNIAQGAGQGQRVGDSFQYSLFNFRVVITNNLVAADTSNKVRFIVFQWKPNDLTAPAVTDILLSATWDSQYEFDNRHQYRILYDRTFFLTPILEGTTNTVAPNSTRLLNFKLKPKLKKVDCTFGTVNGTNKLYILYISDSLVPVHPTIEYLTNVYYTDA